MRSEQNEEKFINIGLLILNVSKIDWMELNAFYQNFSKDYVDPEQKRQIQNNTVLFCQIQANDDFIYNDRTEYKLKTYQIKCGMLNQYLNTKQLQISLNNKKLILNAKTNHKEGILNDILNLQHKNICKFFNPIPLEEPQKKIVLTNAQNQQETYYFDNIQQGEFFTIGLQVLVNQNFLNKSTQYYQDQFENQPVEGSKKQLKQNQYLKTKNKMTNQEKRICQKFTRQLIIIFVNLINKNEAKKGLKNIERVFSNRNYKLNKLSYVNSYKQEYNQNQIEISISNKNNVNTNQNNTIHSFNFAEQKNEVGMFFDLDRDITPQWEKPNGFQGELKPYQARALTWMLFREGVRDKIKNIGMDISHTPYWWDTGNDLGLKQNLLINTQLKTIVWKRKVEKKCDGGILADQMGLGKTIMIIALILAHSKNQNSKTLIIAPLSVVKQWQQQIKKFAPSLKVHVANQQKLSDEKYGNSNVVLTTEGKVRSELKLTAEQSTIKRHNWYRIVIDEAHNFKNSKTAMAKTVYELNAEYRWCLTGTPTQNSIADLYSLVKFLRFMPWCLMRSWQSLFPKDIKKITGWHFMKMKDILKGILLRRKKQSIENGQKLINIPKVDVKVHIVKMSQSARKFYQYVDFTAQLTLNSLQKLQEKIKNTVNTEKRKILNISKRSKYQQVLCLMMRMRMICCHQFLSKYKNKFISFQNFYKQYIQFLEKNKIKKIPKSESLQQKCSALNESQQNWDKQIVAISKGRQYTCLECKNDTELLVTPCVHVFCKYCISQHLLKQCVQSNEKMRQHFQKIGKSEKYKAQKLRNYKGRCPHCSKQLKYKWLFEMPQINQFGRPFEELQLNQKILVLLDYLKKMKQNEKALIFTSFIGMLKLMSYILEKQKISCLTVQGSDNYESRHRKIAQFNKKGGIKILIITLKTGAVGLNLQIANKVFFMDPWWNPAIEDQAIGRVHRIGQQKQVEAIKFITESSIQARILKLSIYKKQMSDSILDIDDVINDTRYSKSRSQMKFLLSMEETLQQNSQEQEYQQKQSQMNQQENAFYYIQNSKIQNKEIQQQNKQQGFLFNQQSKLISQKKKQQNKK